MAEWHLSADLFRRFLNGTAGKEEVQRLIRHLIRGCDVCQSLASRIVAETGYWFPKRGFAGQGNYEDAFATALTFADSAQRRAAVSRLRGWANGRHLRNSCRESALP